MNRLILFFQNWISDHTNKAFVVLIGCILIYSVIQKSTVDVETHSNHDPFTADTVIPEGFVLVPIEISNKESLKTLVGNFALVDLFTVANHQQKGGIRVGKRLKLLKAPLKDDEFAVLVAENETESVMQWPGPFLAVIQNPDIQGSTQVSAPSKKRSRIEYQKGGSL